VKYCIWSIALYGDKTMTHWKVDQKYLEVLKCGTGRGWRSAGQIM
jgi:hypothetical protein